VRDELGAADRNASWSVGLGLCLTLAAILGLPGPDAWFMGLAPTIGILGGGAAPLGLFMERFRGGWARVLLSLAAVALGIAGAAWLKSASLARVTLAYFVPAALFLAAAATLHAPRLRERAT
jgi:hypothetical protein